MIKTDTIDAFNNRLNVDLNNIRTMTPGELDRVKAYGSQAEALLKNRDLAQFIHHFKFDLADMLAGINGFTEQDNQRRVAIAHELRAIDAFVASLQRAVYIKNRVVTQQEEGPRAEPTDITKRAYTV